MQYIRKHIALLLAFLFLAVLPLSAFAESEYDSYICGAWRISAAYGIDTEKYELMHGDASSLTVNSDGTALYRIGSRELPAAWEYTAAIDSGYLYRFTVDYEGSSLDLTLAYCNSGYLAGDAVLLIGNTLYRYQKA